MSIFPDLSLYQLILLGILCGVTLLCVLCVSAGWLFRWGKNKPPFYGQLDFPTLPDEIFTLVYISVFAAMNAMDLLQANGAENTEASAVSFGLMLMLLFYMPLVVRLVNLPTRPRAWLDVFKATGHILAGLVALLMFAGMLEAFGITKMLMELTGCPQNQDVVNLFINSDTAGKIHLGVSACVVAPIGEECLFRGFLYNVLRKRSCHWVAMLLSSLFFASVHGALIQFLPLLVFGLIQCSLYGKYRTLWVPMAFHALFNSCSMLMMLFGDVS